MTQKLLLSCPAERAAASRGLASEHDIDVAIALPTNTAAHHLIVLHGDVFDG